MTAAGPGAATVSSATLVRRIFAAVLLANLAIVSLLALSLRQSRIQYQERAAISTRNLASVLEKQLLGTLEKVDLALLSATDEVNRQLARGGLEGGKLGASLALLQARLPELDGLRMADRSGQVRYGSGVVSGKTINCADRDFFRSARDNPRAGLVISEPILGRISGKWSIALARRLSRADGSFAGIVYAVISLEQIGKTLSRLDIGPNGLVSVRDGQLRMIVRHPWRTKLFWTIFIA